MNGALVANLNHPGTTCLPVLLATGRILNLMYSIFDTEDPERGNAFQDLLKACFTEGTLEQIRLLQQSNDDEVRVVGVRLSIIFGL